MLQPVPVEASREDLFVERYRKLRAWSLQMTQHDHELAEDLLHDLFIQFTLDAPELHEIRNLDAYLYAMLRNLHLARRRRDSRNTLQQLSIVEYDSAELGLRTVDFRDQIQAQEELRRMSLHACARKETSKTASVLILRYFHGYYPEEIVKVMRTSRAWIDTSLKLARREAKAALSTEPGKANRLEFINHTPAPEVSPTGYAQDLDDFLAEIRQTIFQSRKGDCFTDDSLRELYSADTIKPIECLQLSHIVSCRHCLDGVNELLGLPLLAERNATETLGRDARKRGGRGGGGDGGGGGLSNVKLNHYRRRAKDTFVHKPAELCVAVNGYALGSQRITSERSELNLVVDEEVKVGFVEVFTEQKIRLLLMPIDELPPDGPGERVVRIRLSDERLLSLTLRLASPSPTIQVVYSDPHFNDAPELPDAFDAVPSDQDREQLPTSLVAARAPDKEPKSRSQSQSLAVEPKLVELFQPSIIERARRAIANSGFWLRPQTVTAVFALLLLAGFIYLNLRTRVTSLSAPQLLAQSIAAEDALAARTDQVLHRTFTLDERDASGKVLSNRRIELWHSAEKGTTARRLYDDRGALVASVWRRSDGVQTLYHHGSKPQLQLAPEKRDGAGISFDSVWQFSPSAKEFVSLTGNTQQAKLEEDGNVYVISADDSVIVSTASGSDRAGVNSAPSAVNKPTLIKTTLTLSKADLHATELRLTLRQGNELREYRILESSMERRAPSTVPPSVFEPDPELIIPAREPESRNSKLDANSLTPGSSSPPPALATADLEAEVLRLLNQAGADMDDQTNVSRTSEGKLLIIGVVETADRKAEILRALTPVVSNPAVTVKIETVAEVVSRQKRSPSTESPVTIERVEVTKANIPVYQDVRRYLSAGKEAGKDGNQADEDVRQFAAKILNRSRLIMSEAGTLKRLAGQFSADDLRTMSPEAHAKWLAVMRSHAHNCEQEARGLRQELQPIFFPGTGPGADIDAIDINDDASLARAAARLFDLVAANDRVVRSAFTISAQPAATTAIRSSQFWGALKSAEGLAAKIGKQ